MQQQLLRLRTVIVLFPSKDSTKCTCLPVILQAAMQESKRESIAVPESVMEAVNRTLANVEDMQTHLHHFLSLSDPEVLAEMPPLQRAQFLLLLAKVTSTLFTVKLRCSGINPDDHPVKSELETPLRPSTTLNCQAATRFIEHSLPDLTPEQKQSMMDLSKGEVPKINHQDRSQQRKRKHQYSEEKSVKIAAKEFLEKAAHELFGNNYGGIQGPMVDISDDYELPMH